MAEQRIVTIYMDSTAMTEMKEATDPKAWQEAIGYLSTWNLTFPTVEIYVDTSNSTDMVAVYFNEQGQRGYVIGAVWHEDHYGFHS